MRFGATCGAKFGRGVKRQAFGYDGAGDGVRFEEEESLQC